MLQAHVNTRDQAEHASAERRAQLRIKKGRKRGCRLTAAVIWGGERAPKCPDTCGFWGISDFSRAEHVSLSVGRNDAAALRAKRLISR